MTSRMRREIDQILRDSGENDQNSSNPDHLTPEEAAAKAAATRAAWGLTAEEWNAWIKRHPDSVAWGFVPLPPAPYVPRNRRDPVRVACFVGCALLMGVVWGQIVRWAL